MFPLLRATKYAHTEPTHGRLTRSPAHSRSTKGQRGFYNQSYVTGARTKKSHHTSKSIPVTKSDLDGQYRMRRSLFFTD